MAAGQLNLSRRALLGAAAAAPVALSLDTAEGTEEAPLALGAASGASPAAEDWRAALAAFRAAEGAVEEAGRVCAEAAAAEVGAAEELFGDRLEALYEALRALLAVPAPDVAALLLKVELAFEHEIATLAGTAPAVAALRRDARRFAAAAAAGA